LTKKIDSWTSTPGKQTFFFTKCHPEKFMKDLESIDLPEDKAVEVEEGDEGMNEEDTSDEVDVTIDKDTYKA
jgi:hypothetical protein